MIPILNPPHFIKGIYLSLILFVTLIDTLLKEIKFKPAKSIIMPIFILLSTFTCFTSTYYFNNWIKTIQDEDYRFKKEEPFYGGMYSQELIVNMDHMIEYIENCPNHVIVMSAKACYYMIPAKKSNGAMDLPFKGNLGGQGERGLIQQIENMENTEILIEKDENQIQYQESKVVRDYIIQNMTKKGEIEEFEIYKKTETF